MVHRLKSIAVAIRVRSGRDERGATFVIFTLLLAVFMVFVALVLDMGNARSIRRQAQNAADASALAGANVLFQKGSPDFSYAVTTVETYAHGNFGVKTSSWTSCSDPNALPFTPDFPNADTCISFDSSVAPTHVRVLLPARRVAFLFGGFAGLTSENVNAAAVARVNTFGISPCGFCVIGTGSPYDGQNGTLNVSGDSGVGVNGSASTKNNGSVNVTPPGGTTIYSGGTWSGNFNPTPTGVSGPLPDPLGSYPVPSFAGLSGQPGCVGGVAVPGIYSSIPTCHLNAGLYVITGSTHISGQTTIDASAGVTLYLTCGSGTTPAACASGGQGGADLICTGNASFAITAPSTGPTAGMAIFFDRNNTSGLDCRGNGAGAVTGTIYGASASLKMRGNGGVCDFNALVVVKSAAFSGSPSGFCVNYNHSQNVQATASPPALVQ